MTTIPNEYTACEVYQGYTIGLAGQRYSAFDRHGVRVPLGSRSTRAECRRMIDRLIPDGGL